MAARWAAFGVWLLVAGSALFWGLRLFAAGPAVPPGVPVAGASALPMSDLSRVLGAELRPVAEESAAPPPEASRYKLVGVVAPRGAGPGVALIAIDGQPPRAYRVGARVDGATVLRSVQWRAARLGTAGVPGEITLELPVLPPPATGQPGAPAVAGQPPAGFALPGLQPLQPRLPPGMLPGMAPTAPYAGAPVLDPATGEPSNQSGREATR